MNGISELIVCGIVACMVCCCVGACDDSHSKNKGDDKRTTIADIETQCKHAISSLDSKGKNRPGDELEALAGVLTALSSERFRQVVEYVSDNNGEQKPIGFELALRQGLIVYCLREGDKADLIRVMASYCPEWIGIREVELYLVVAAPASVEDPILVLVSAFKESGNRENKNRIVSVLKRAFRGLVTPEGDQESFVSRCQQWYEDNRSQLSIDLEYGFNRDLHRGEEVSLFRRGPASSQNSPSGIKRGIKRDE
jgi:hypothetical protein